VCARLNAKLKQVKATLRRMMHLVGSFWPYMIPFSVSVWDAAAPPPSLTCMFYSSWIMVFPMVLIYTVAVYWIFRGKVPRANTGA
jgi:cytochrome bd-type quinol oxidase subunit 2